MCGITGFISRKGSDDSEELVRDLTKMMDPIIHRGPDSFGTWVNPDLQVAFGHRRLSILDLSQEGHQPMISQTGRYVIVFNGEIYNFNALREQIRQESPEVFRKLRGHSDTEIMLACIELWGLNEAVKSFVGMFAFAVLDKKDRMLHLVRDRMGEKPLYYGWAGDVFLFGSELKALKAHQKFNHEINRNALTLYLRHNYIPAPYSIYSSVFKLMPGHILSINIKSYEYHIVPYWKLEQIIDYGKQQSFIGTEEEAISQLDTLLRESIKHQMVADVPLGAFLSGGIDSTTVVAIMQQLSSKPIKTFTIGFHEIEFNEAEHAKAVAKHLGTDHTEMYVTPEHAINVIPLLPDLYDEPFSDSSQIPTYLVAKLAKKQVTVCLSGDGGDELFGGYQRYFTAKDAWSKLSYIPSFGRKSASRLIKSISVETWNRNFEWLNPLLSKSGRSSLVGDKIYKLAELMEYSDSKRFYQNLVSHYKTPQSIVIGGTEPQTLFDAILPKSTSNYIEDMMYLDTLSYLPDDILVKVDRAGMGVSLESRIPLLDHRIVEFAWRLPLAAKVKNTTGKWILRQVLYQYVPKSLMERPKKGFGVPIDKWLRGPLREWGEHLLSERKMKFQGYFDPMPIRQKWEEHMSGQRNWQSYLWDILMFQAWLENN